MGGPCDYCVTPVPFGLGFGTALFLGLGLRGPDLGLGLDNFNSIFFRIGGECSNNINLKNAGACLVKTRWLFVLRCDCFRQSKDSIRNNVNCVQDITNVAQF